MTSCENAMYPNGLSGAVEVSFGCRVGNMRARSKVARSRKSFSLIRKSENACSASVLVGDLPQFGCSHRQKAVSRRNGDQDAAAEGRGLLNYLDRKRGLVRTTAPLAPEMRRVSRCAKCEPCIVPFPLMTFDARTFARFPQRGPHGLG